MNDIAALQQTLGEWAEKPPERLSKTGWIVGFGYDDAQLTDLFYAISMRNGVERMNRLLAAPLVEAAADYDAADGPASTAPVAARAAVAAAASTPDSAPGLPSGELS